MPERVGQLRDAGAVIAKRRDLLENGYTQGYKAAVIDVGGSCQNPPDFACNPVEPEKVNAYEIGAKFDNRVVSLEAAGFYYDYKNLQVSSAIVTPVRVTLPRPPAKFQPPVTVAPITTMRFRTASGATVPFSTEAALMGSVAHRVMSNAACPVLVVRPPRRKRGHRQYYTTVQIKSIAVA